MQAAEGHITINLYGIDYPMVFNNTVYNAFKERTGKDFNKLGAQLYNEWCLMTDLGYFDDNASVDIASCEAAARFASIVDKETAANLFYLMAKECNSKVEVGEFEEAVTYEHFDNACFKNGVLPNVVGDYVTEGYPVRFFEVFMFSMDMIKSPNKVKKKNSFVSSLKKLLLNR